MQDSAMDVPSIEPPLEKNEPAFTPATLAAPAAAPLRGRILVIDDDDMLLRLIEQILEADNLQVICTTSAREALGKIERGERFDVILSDVRMPDMTGIEFYNSLLARHPNFAQRVAFISGGPTTGQVAFLKSVPNLRIEKPFKIATLRKTVEHILAAHSAEGVLSDPS
jgi:two-component system NtrC family sensor kinase